MKKRILSGIIVCILILTTPALAFADEEIETQAAGIANNGLAGIYIDINAAPYTDFANIPNWGKYAYGPSGCAWFASARVKQLTGKGNMIYSGSSWWNQQYANLGFGRGSTISAPAIACYSGHVAIVEKIEGNYAYISEGGNTSYPGNSYCVIRKRSISDITSGALGFVYLGNAVSQPQPAAPSFTDQAVTYVDDWNAIVYTRVLNPGRRVVAQAGCRIYNASGSLLKSYTENCNLSTSYVNYNCNFVSDMNYPLDPGTSYKYQQFVIIDGKEYADQMRSFSTTGSRDNLAPKISNVKLDVYDTYYTIKCDVYEETEFIRKSIEFPTWTEHNGQDDLIYHGDGGFTYLPGTDTNHYRTYFYDIPISEHNNEKGNYITRISARDAAGNTSSLDVVVSLGEYKYKVTDNSAVTQDTYQHPSSLTVPATLGAFPVKEANLSDLEGIESITYSNGITKVGDIRNAESLVQIKLPDTLEELGNINVPNLETINLPDTLIEMGWLQAPKMKSIDFPASLLKLDGISAENMENITLPENLKVLGYYGFNGCKKLKNVKLPASLEAIYTNRSGGVLEQCESLQKIELDEKNPNFLLINGILMNKVWNHCTFAG